MKTILCPTDFSKNASRAFEYACALGKKFKSGIILMHAFETPVMYSEASLSILPEATENIKLSAQKKLNSWKEKFSKLYKEVSIETLLIEASTNRIVKEANRLNADVIVMGTTGTTKMERLLMGSTTSDVIQHAGCPVLCIPRNSVYNGIHKIVFATDLKEDNLQSAITVTPFAKQLDAEIVFVFVDDKHLIHSDEKISDMTQKIRKQVKYPKISGYISKNNNIAKGLEYFLKKFPAEMVVMFTHHKHFPGSLFNQSITKLVSHQVEIPLLVLNTSDRPIVGNG